ncbi:MAG TPA: helix-turn-helix domain-containing protein [Ktedonobacteraceae bacterium]
MPYPQKYPLRPFIEQEERALSQIAKASSERVDTVRRAKALLAVSQGAPFARAARQSGFKSADSVSQVVQRFNQQGLDALFITAGRGRKPTYTSQERQRILEELHREPDREKDQSATWSLKLLERALRKATLPTIGASTIRRVFHAAGFAFGRSRTWCQTGTALRVRKAGVVRVHDPQAEEKQRLIELAYRIAETAGVQLWCQDEAGPYQAIPQSGTDWHRQEHPRRLPHEYTRGGTAKLLTLFRPKTGSVRGKGVLSAPNAILHPWLKEELTQILKPILQREAEMSRPTESEQPVGARWRTWVWPHERDEGLPPLRLILVWDNLAGHLTPDMVLWLFQHGIMPLYTPLGGSWLNMAESIQRIIVPRALAGQHPQSPQDIIDWLEQTVAGWNADPTSFVWGGKRKARRERARLRRLAGSGAAIMKGYSIAA